MSRRGIVAVVRPFVKVLFPYTLVGGERIPPVGGPPTILCANHISNMDPVFLVASEKRPIRFMAKAELFKNRLVRWFVEKQMGAFPVHRGQGDTGALEVAGKLVSEGELLGIFPEGTRSKDGNLGRAKSGAVLIAAQTGAQILPVAIRTKHQKVRLFRRTYIVVGEPLSLEELHLQGDKPELRYASRRLMEAIAALLEEPLC